MGGTPCKKARLLISSPHLVLLGTVATGCGQRGGQTQRPITKSRTLQKAPRTEKGFCRSPIQGASFLPSLPALFVPLFLLQGGDMGI